MPTILHINTVAEPRNGVGQIMRAIHSRAPQYGFDSKIFAGYGRRVEADYIVTRTVRRYVNALRSRLAAEDGFLDSVSARRLNERVESLRPDILHVHNLHGYYCDLQGLRRTLDRMGIPIVVTMHDLWLTTGRCAYPPEDCNGPGNGCAECPFPHRYPAKWTKGSSMMQTKSDFLAGTTVVVPSRWMASRTERFNPVIIPNGVDTDIFKPDPRSTQKAVKQILAVATRWTETKGIDDIVRLADRLPERYTLALVGAGVPRHPRIKNLGYVDDPAALARLMAESDALISAARQEAFGLTVAEALAVGIPTVVRRGTAPAEFVPDSRFHVDFADPDAVIAALDDTAKFTQTTTAVSLDDMARQYYDLYRHALNF